MPNSTETVMPFPDAVSIFKAGIFDALNPCAFVSIFWLALFLAIVGKTQYRILLFGIHFIIAYFIASYLITIGLFEVAGSFINIQVILRYGQFFIALIVLVSGGVNMYDWWTLTQGQDKSKHILRYPVILYSEDVPPDAQAEKLGVRSVKMRQNPTFYAWVIGVAAAILASFWPPSFEVSRLQSGLILPGDRFVFFLMLFYYEMIFVLPIVMAFGLIVFAVYSPERLKRLRGSLGAVKMAMSGMMFGWGIGIIYLLR